MVQGHKSAGPRIFALTICAILVMAIVLGEIHQLGKRKGWQDWQIIVSVANISHFAVTCLIGTVLVRNCDRRSRQDIQALMFLIALLTLAGSGMPSMGPVTQVPAALATIWLAGLLRQTGNRRLMWIAMA